MNRDPTGPGEDYHDYVIKDGRFVGEFERMYQRCADPWHQISERPLANDFVAFVLGTLDGIENVLDVGSGLGAFTATIAGRTGAYVLGIDISYTACARAKDMGSNARFAMMDVRALGLRGGSFDLIVVSEVLWYVLPDLEAVLRGLSELLRPNGTLVLVQQFYDPERQQYGKEVMRRPQDLLRYVPIPVKDLVVFNPQGDPKAVLIARRSVPGRTERAL